MNLKQKGHCSELTGLELLQSQQGDHSESSIKPEHLGVSGKVTMQRGETSLHLEELQVSKGRGEGKETA